MGYFTAANALATPFDITTNNHGNNFYDQFTHGSTLTINVAIPDATNVYTLINAYAPQNGFEIATVEFVGSNGATETFDLVNGTNVRDFYQGGFANSINGTTTENAFTVTNTVGGAATGNSSDGEFGTYNIDEQNFMLSGAFASQTLTKIIITDLGFQAGGSDVPIVLGVTAQSAEPVDHWVGGSADWSTAGDSSSARRRPPSTTPSSMPAAPTRWTFRRRMRSPQHRSSSTRAALRSPMKDR